jgi:hypothetical protein
VTDRVALGLDPKQPKILGIDIENQPLWYGGNDFTYDWTVCVTGKWVGSPEDETYTACWIGQTDKASVLQILSPLREAIEQCDALLGHNFRHDWKGLCALYNHLEQPPLVKKPIIDTMRCIPAGMPRGMDFLSAKFGFRPKPHLTQHDWIEAVLWHDPQKIALVKERNRIDVLITEDMYWKERELGWL